jgi:hypothetical protein
LPVFKPADSAEFQLGTDRLCTTSFVELYASSLQSTRTRRSSERAPAGTPSGDADAPGGWHPSLTFAFGDIKPLMNTQPVTPASHREMIRQYPITGLVEGWYFRQEEVSAGCFVVEASDVYGRKISRQGIADSETAMAECIQFAKALIQRGHGIAEQGCSSERADCDFVPSRSPPAPRH